MTNPIEYRQQNDISRFYDPDYSGYWWNRINISAIDECQAWITHTMYAWAHEPNNIRNFRGECKQILSDYDLENKAANSYWYKWNESIKAVVDDMIVNHGATLERQGRYYYINFEHPYYIDSISPTKRIFVDNKSNFIVKYFEMAYRRLQEWLQEEEFTS